MKSHCRQALVVSSKPLHCAALEANLAQEGFLVTLAATAREGFFAAEKRSFDVVVVDYETPQGTGVDLARQLRYVEQYSDTPIILLAGKMGEPEAKKLRDNWWMFVANEPYNFAALVHAVAQYFPQPAH